jgi:hypothetical protein
MKKEMNELNNVNAYRGVSRSNRFSRRRQKGELSLLEAGVWIAGAAITAIIAVKAGAFVLNAVRTNEFTSEVQSFKTGLINATLNDADFSSITTTAMIANGAFDAVKSRISADRTTVTGRWGGLISVWSGGVFVNGDTIGMTYPTVPTSVCASALQTLAADFTQIKVNGTAVYGPSLPYNDQTVGSTCHSGGTTSIVEFDLTRQQ